MYEVKPRKKKVCFFGGSFLTKLYYNGEKQYNSTQQQRLPLGGYIHKGIFYRLRYKKTLQRAHRFKVLIAFMLINFSKVLIYCLTSFLKVRKKGFDLCIDIYECDIWLKG